MDLNDKERNTFEIISKVVNGEITRKEAMFELNKYRQQIYRLINFIIMKVKKYLFIIKKNMKSLKN